MATFLQTFWQHGFFTVLRDVIQIFDVFWRRNVTVSVSFMFFLCIIGFKISFAGAVGTGERFYVGVAPTLNKNGQDQFQGLICLVPSWQPCHCQYSMRHYSMHHYAKCHSVNHTMFTMLCFVPALCIMFETDALICPNSRLKRLHIYFTCKR